MKSDGDIKQEGEAGEKMCGKAMEKDKRVEQSRDMKMGEETRLETSREKEARVTNKIEHSKIMTKC